MPANKLLGLVVADATTCTPQCGVLQVVSFDAPSNSSEESVCTDGMIEAE